MRHCNSIFKSDDIWFLLDSDTEIKRKLYLASCPVCGKEIAVYTSFSKDNNSVFEKYYYSGGAKRIKERLKKDITSTMLGFKISYKMPSGFKYGINKEIKRKGKVVGIKQFASDFHGNKILVKQLKWENKSQLQ